ncbi:hypothetical protein GCM10027404_07850 [Arthrobacter tumbae]
MTAKPTAAISRASRACLVRERPASSFAPGTGEGFCDMMLLAYKDADRPFRPPVPGILLRQTFSLRSPG